ncbi:hypothetical protein [Saccharothrix longispora]|uniref:hypothetical protein n=1 Tax=Saccharothrix longispora TaxID=33920 RepID=UPI0031E7B343
MPVVPAVRSDRAPVGDTAKCWMSWPDEQRTTSSPPAPTRAAGSRDGCTFGTAALGRRSARLPPAG